MNWGMIPFHLKDDPSVLEVNDYVYVPKITEALDGDMQDIEAYVIHEGTARKIHLYVMDMTPEERKIVKAGCLINYNRNRKNK